jgi:hypothetical protein
MVRLHGEPAYHAHAAYGMTRLQHTRGVDMAMTAEVAVRAGGRFQVCGDRGCPPPPAGEGWRARTIVAQPR